MFKSTVVTAAVVAWFIERQRDRWHNRALPLNPSMRARLNGYFSEEDLSKVRLAENVSLPLPILPSVAAITFDHLVLARQPVWESLLFHELVHVAQFRLLGVRQFSEQYVQGFLETRRYESIPLEACAFELEQRFLRGAGPFLVENEVRRWLNLP